ncbi:MAG: hypothetical protein HC905_04195 [Bacteroidales bacterium]|nr:hypothetical protein [Bacteroidales bacterium]
MATNEAGALLVKFLPEVQKSAILIREISAASLEQNQSIESINHSLKDYLALSTKTKRNFARNFRNIRRIRCARPIFKRPG